MTGDVSEAVTYTTWHVVLERFSDGQHFTTNDVLAAVPWLDSAPDRNRVSAALCYFAAVGAIDKVDRVGACNVYRATVEQLNSYSPTHDTSRKNVRRKRGAGASRLSRLRLAENRLKLAEAYTLLATTYEDLAVMLDNDEHLLRATYYHAKAEALDNEEDL